MALPAEHQMPLRPGVRESTLFTRLARDGMRPLPLVVRPSDTCGSVVERLTESGESSALVYDEARGVVGILTERDIAHRVAYRIPSETAVEQVMSRPVHLVHADEYLYQAIGRMRRYRLRHMPVVDASGTPVGMLDLHAALGTAAAPLVERIDRLTHEGTREGLKAVKDAQVEVAEQLFAEGMRATEIQDLLTAVNRDLHRRVVELCAAEMAENGWGPQPVDYALIVMGSGGRGESFLAPDQDNGMILEDYPDARHKLVDTWFIELAERMTADLDAIGFPLCRGNVMATNPVWRKTISQWREQTRIWMRRRGTILTRLADIFFDFRAAAGQDALAEDLRHHVVGLAHRNPSFIREMYGDGLNPVGLKVFGRLVTEQHFATGAKLLDLKYRGTLPLVESARLMALRHGIEAPSTLGRLAELADAGAVGAEEHEALDGAFEHLTGRLLAQQIHDYRQGRSVSNRIEIRSLTRRERSRIVESLRAIDGFQKRVKSELTADVF